MDSLDDHQLQQIWGWNHNLSASADFCVHEVISTQVQAQQSAIAISAWDGELTYSDLDEHSTHLAFELKKHGVGPGLIVPLCFEKSMWTVVAMLGVLRAGGAIVLLDASLPEKRLLSIAQQCNAKVACASYGNQELCSRLVETVIPVGPGGKLVESVLNDDHPCTVDPSSPMYVCFTSGSTGVPKGVVMSHSGFLTACKNQLEVLGFNSQSRVFDFASYSFDVAIINAIGTLMTGGCLCIPSDHDRRNRLSETLQATHATIVNVTPTVARLLDPAMLPELETLILLGEPVNLLDLQRFWGKIRVLNTYGATECAVVATINSTTQGPKEALTIGRGAGVLTWIVDKDDHEKLVPIGTIGELLLESPALSQGYLGDSEKTASTFIQDPTWLLQGAAGYPGRHGRLYKTGDLVQYNHDGTLSYIGRKDTQVKIRGQRVELGEIEYHAQRCLPSAKEVVAEVIKPSSETAEKSILAVFMVMHKDNDTGGELPLLMWDIAEGARLVRMDAKVRAELGKELPSHMIPTVYLAMDEMPRTASGKTDRKVLRQFGSTLSLQQIARLNTAGMDSKTDPQTEAEKRLRDLWAEALNIEAGDIGIHDSFFQLGGDSLAAMRLVRIAKTAGLKLSVADVLMRPILSEQALVEDEAMNEDVEDIEAFSLLDSQTSVSELCTDLAALCHTAPSLIEDAYPCTPLQQGLLSLTAKTSGDYVSHTTMPIHSITDVPSFLKAWEDTVRVNEILRTRIVDHPELGLVQVVCKEELLWDVVKSPEDYFEEAKSSVTELGGALSKFVLVGECLEAPESIVWTAHHSIFDGQTLSLIYDEVRARYREQAVGKRPKYNKFIEKLAHSDHDGSRQFWKSYLDNDDIVQFPALPTSIQEPRADAVLARSLGLHSNVNATPSTLLRAALAILIHQHTGSLQVTFGTVTSGRSTKMNGINEIIGPTIATVPISVRLRLDQQVSDYLQSLQQSSAEMITHEQFGLQNIAKIGNSEQAASEFQTLIVVQPQEGSDVKDENDVLAGMKMLAPEGPPGTYALAFECNLLPDSVEVMAYFDKRVLNEWQVSRMLEQLDVIVSRLSIAQPEQTVGQINHIAPQDADTIWNWNADLPSAVESCIHTLVEQQAQVQPTVTAISSWDGELTYSELNELSTRLALQLIYLGVGADVIVPLFFEKSIWTVVAMMGVVKAGGAFLSLDPTQAEDHWRSILKRTHSHTVLLSASYAKLPLPEDCRGVVVSSASMTELPAVRARLPAVEPSDAAYVIFTSGSTGQPKGVIIEHRSFSTSCCSHGPLLSMGPGTRLLEFASYTFDASLFEIFTTLTQGGTLVIPSTEQRLGDLSEVINSMAINFAGMTPTVARTINPEDVPTLKTVILGGEASTKDDWEQWKHLPHFFNGYGPTETTIVSVISRCDEASVGQASIGTGVGCSTWIVDCQDHTKLAPLGAVGELLIEGPVLSRGYLDDPVKTAAAFIQDPQWLLEGSRKHSGRRGRLYKTGDLVRYNENGSLTYIGRKDTQVKIRGQRVELGEIEHQTRDCLSLVGPVVAEVIRFAGQESRPTLVLFTEARTPHAAVDDALVTVSQVQDDIDLMLVRADKAAALAERLPSHMIPTILLRVSKVPVTKSDKIDRKGLRQLGAVISAEQLMKLQASTIKQQPQTEAETFLCGLWAQVLNTDAAGIGANDNFFRLGGDSILAMKLSGAVRKAGSMLSVSDVFRHPILLEQALALSKLAKDGMKKVEPFSLLNIGAVSESCRDELARLCNIQSSSILDAYPCTALQEGLLSLTDKGATNYETRVVLQVPAGESVLSLQSAWEKTVQQAEILRTRIVHHPQLGFLQVVCDTGIQWATSSSLENYLEMDELIPMKLGETLSRFAVVSEGESDTCFVVWTVHHSLYDGHSLSLVLDLVKANHNGNALQERPAYNAFIQHLAEKSPADSETFWRSYLAEGDFIAFPPLPRSIKEPFANCMVEHTLAGANMHTETTASTLLRGALALLISQHSNSTDVLFGAVVSGRNASLSGMADIIGPAIATVPVRIRLNKEQNVVEYLKAIQDDSTEMIAHEQFGLQKITKIGDEGRAACGFQTLLVVQPGNNGFEEDDIIRPVNVISKGDIVSTYGLTMECFLGLEDIKIKAHFDPRILPQWKLEKMLAQLGKLFEQLAMEQSDQTLEQISSLTVHDMETIWNWNKDAVSVAELCVHEAIEKHVRARPEAVAVTAWDGEMTYSELDIISTKLAHQLVDLGVGRDVVVPLCFDKSIWIVVAMLGVLKAGGAFLSLNPTQAIDRQKMILQKSKAHIILTSDALNQFPSALGYHGLVVSKTTLDKFPSHLDRSSLPSIGPDALAYIIFTSGSTGEPKGVAIEHHSITTNSLEYGSAYGLNSSSRVFQFSSFTFDACIFEIFMTLVNGGVVLVPSEEQRMGALEVTIASMEANVLFATPTVARTIRRANIPTLHTLIMGGEILLDDDLKAWEELPNFFIAYGPTETTVFATIHRYDAKTHIQGIIGLPVGCTTWVVNKDNHNQLAPVGSTGELLIEGNAVGRGYLNDPKRTADSFIEDPSWLLQGSGDHKGRRGRLYKTGDLVQYNGDGTLVFISRKDNQIKIRGQRLELGEVEHHLRECVPATREILAEIIQPTGPRSKPMLAGFVVGHESDSSITVVSELTERVKLVRMDPGVDAALAQRLPDYMIPAVYFGVPEIPLMPSGKANRKLLREIGSQLSLQQLAELQSVGGEAKQQPRSEAEKHLQDLWAQALNIEPRSIGISDDFFRIGGDSITAMKISSASLSIGYRLRVADIFRARTIAQLAKGLTHAPTPSLPVAKASSKGPFCLSPIQKLHFAIQPMANVCFDQCFLLHLERPVSPADLTSALQQVITRHAALRSCFKTDSNGTWEQFVAQEDGDFFHLPVLHSTDDYYQKSLMSQCRNMLDIENGPVVAGALFDAKGLQSLFLTIHHLVVDLVSWRILLQDLESLLLSNALDIAHSIGFGDWCDRQDEYAQQHLDPEVEHPLGIKSSLVSYWGMEERENIIENVISTEFTLDQTTTSALFGDANQAFQTRPIEIMLAVLVHSFHSVFSDRNVPAIFCEGHGREPWDDELEISQTVGWFTTMFPLQMENLEAGDMVNAIIRTKDSHRRLKSNGWSYFTSQFRTDETRDAFSKEFPVEIMFNYEGMYHQMERPDSVFKFLPLPSGMGGKTTEKVKRLALFDINFGVSNGQGHVTFSYDQSIGHQDRISQWVRQYQNNIQDAVGKLSMLPRQLTLADFANIFETYENLSKFQLETVPRLCIEPEDIQDIFGCSPMQEALIIHQIKDPESYIPVFLSEIMPGPGQPPVDTLRLERAWKDVVKKHALMRTLLVDGLPGMPRPAHVVLKAPKPSISHHQVMGADLSIETAQKCYDRVQFQNRGLQHHLAIFKLDNDRVMCCLEISHVIIDAHSRTTLLHDLVAAYNGNLDDAEISYRDFISYTHNMSSDDVGEYWGQYIQEVEPCHLPTTPSLRNNGNLWMKEAPVPNVDVGKVQDFCSTHGITMATLVTAAWGAVLELYTGVRTPCFGMLVSGRDLPVPDIDDIIGPTINILATKLAQEDTENAIQSLRRLQDQYASSLQYQFYSLARIQHAHGYGSELFNTAVSVESQQTNDEQPKSGISVMDIEGYDPTEFVVTFHASLSPSNMDLVLTYRSDKIQDSFATQLAGAVSRAVMEIATHPDKSIRNLNIIADEDASLIWSWNKEVPPAIEECCHDLITRRAMSQPEAMAVSAWDGELSYMELENLSTRLAHHLIDLGVGRETIVPLCFEKSLWMMVAVLAVFKAGGAYVALDPKQATNRQRVILEKTRAHIILAGSTCSDISKVLNCNVQIVSQELFDKLFTLDANLSLPSFTAGNAAYLMFTSGSTGQPKGVVIEHRAASTASHHHGIRFGLSKDSRVFQFTSYTFDVCIVETLATLIYGGTVIVPSEYQRLNKLSSTITEMKANTAFLTPTVSRTIRPDEVPTLTKLILGGEKFLVEDWEQWKHLPNVFNGYGPTETTVFCTSQQFKDTMEEGHIGLPFGCLGWIVDRDNHQRLVPMGHEGELLVEGPLLSRGYHDDPEKTAAAFIEDPDWLTRGARGYKGRRGRVYKTGDLVKYRKDGSLQVIGRKDTQVKIRGQRVELGEIEHHLSECLPVDHVVAEVIQLANQDNNATLAAFIEQSTARSRDNDEISTVSIIEEGFELVRLSAGLSATLAQNLPIYMIPTLFFRVSSMPQTRSGKKTDRELLRDMGSALSPSRLADLHAVSNKAKPQPQTEAERRLRDLWAQVLNIDARNIGTDDSFVQLGGDSIAVMKLVGEANRAGLMLSVADVFLQPTLAPLAARLSSFSVKPKDPVQNFSLVDSQTKEHIIQSAAALIPATLIEDIYPLTSFQRSYIDQDPNYPTQSYNYMFLDLDFQADELLLARSYHTLLNSHPILRTAAVYAQDRPWLIVLKQSAPPILTLDTSEDLEQYSCSLCAKDLEGGLQIGQLLTSLTLVRDQHQKSRLILRLSHAQYDGICMPTILKTLLAHYFDQSPPHSADFASYLEHTEQQRNDSFKYWRDVLSGSQMTQLTYETASSAVVKPQPILVQQEIPLPPLPQGITMASIMSSAWAVTLSLLTGKDDVVYGGLVAGRNAAIPHVADIVGPLVNFVPIRANLDSDQTPLQLFLSLTHQNASLGQADSISFNDIVENCTDWPKDTAFGTIIQHQNIDESPCFELEGTTARSSYYSDLLHTQFRGIFLISYPFKDSVITKILTSSEIMTQEDATKLSAVLHSSLVELLTHSHESLRTCKQRILSAFAAKDISNN